MIQDNKKRDISEDFWQKFWIAHTFGSANGLPVDFAVLSVSWY